MPCCGNLGHIASSAVGGARERGGGADLVVSGPGCRDVRIEEDTVWRRAARCVLSRGWWSLVRATVPHAHLPASCDVSRGGCEERRKKGAVAGNKDDKHVKQGSALSLGHFVLLRLLLLLLLLLRPASAQKTAQQSLAKVVSDAQHSDAMAAVDAGLGGDESRKGLLAGLAATSERLRALEAEGADAHAWITSSSPHDRHQSHRQTEVATSSEVLAELKDEARQELKHTVNAELNGNAYPEKADFAHGAATTNWPHQTTTIERIIADRGRVIDDGSDRDDGSLAWGYGPHDGPATWGARYERCKRGEQQSPINIEPEEHSTQPEDILNIAVLRWVFNNGGGTEKMAGVGGENGGGAPDIGGAGALGEKHQQGLFLTLPVNSRFQEAEKGGGGRGGEGEGARRLLEATEVYTGHALEVEGFGEARLAVGGAWYDLREVVLHTPSEHAVDGKAFDLEMQLVHVVAKGQGGYQYLVVSVLFSTEAGGVSPDFISEVAAAVPSVRESRRVRVQGVAIEKMAQAVQAPLRSYYRYQGSLTTPPCTEGVEWFVAAHPLPLAKADLEVIVALQGRNARPVQPLDGRVVRYVP